MKELFYAVNERGDRLPFQVEEDPQGYRLTLKKETFLDCRELWLLPELGTAKVGEEGFYLLPRNVEMSGDPLVRFLPREETGFSYGKTVLSFYGVKRPGLTAMVRIERNYKYLFDIILKDGIYRVMPHYDFTVDDPVYDDIRLEVIPFGEDAGYADMALMERKIRFSRGEIVALSEKCRREAVEYARKYPLIRIRMGWKPSPSLIRHQCAENEPEMHVACSFDRVCDIADELKRQGVKGAELQLVGWNIGGHDGRFPQLLPPDPRLGGMEGLKKCIAHVKQQGYRISLHTNTIDAVEIADSFTWDDIAVQHGAYLQIGHYSGGLAYHVCQKKQLKNAMRDLPALSELGLNGLHFTDVISIVLPDTCTAPEHPCNTAEGIEYAQKNIRYTAELFGGFSSEGCFDFSHRDLDYGLYVCFGDGFGKKKRPFCEELIPLFELIYHGTLLYNPSSPTVNFTVKEPATRLRLWMNGGRPSFYFHSRFRSGGASNWMGNTDLTCTTDEELSFSVSKIVDGLRIYEENALADRQLVYMTDYQVLEGGLEIASYEDGVRMVGNFSEAPVLFEGKTVAPYGFIFA